MKNLFGMLLIAALFTFASCGGDDGCTEDFTGTYSGTLTCDLSTDLETTVTITGTDGNYVLDAVSFTGNSLDQDGCTLSYDNTAFSTGERGTITLNGNEITVVATTVAAGVTANTCTFVGTK